MYAYVYTITHVYIPSLLCSLQKCAPSMQLEGLMDRQGMLCSLYTVVKNLHNSQAPLFCSETLFTSNPTINNGFIIPFHSNSQE